MEAIGVYVASLRSPERCDEALLMPVEPNRSARSPAIVQTTWRTSPSLPEATSAAASSVVWLKLFVLLTATVT